MVDIRELYERGLKLRKKLFGDEAVEKRMNALADFGEPLQNIINAYAYGDVWQRPALPLKMKSLAMLGITAASNRPEEFRVHLNGALNNGCSPDEIREILLLVALYCGIPAANEAHRIAYEMIKKRKAADT
jgi:4-carboxymuconolactone decarboxylase